MSGIHIICFIYWCVFIVLNRNGFTEDSVALNFFWLLIFVLAMNALYLNRCAVALRDFRQEKSKEDAL